MAMVQNAVREGLNEFGQVAYKSQGFSHGRDPRNLHVFLELPLGGPLHYITVCVSLLYIRGSIVDGSD